MVNPTAAVHAHETDPLLTDKRDLSYRGLFGLIDWLNNLRDKFGHNLLVFLFYAQHLLKGFAYTLIGQTEPYIYRSYRVPAPQMQIYSGLAALPWAMKPIIGLVSDLFPIGSYNKAPYFLLSSLFGTAALLAIGTLPPSVLSLSMLVACVFMFNWQLSTVDLLSEAKYAERMQAVPEAGPALMTYVWFGMQSAALVAVVGSGPAIHYLGPKSCYLLCVLPAAGALVIVLAGYMEEQQLTQEEVSQVRRRFAQQKEACVLCFVMLLCSISLIFTGLVFKSPTANCCVAVVVFFVVLASFSVVFSPLIARFNAFSLIQTSLSWSFGGASYFFYTDTKEQYPEGPHFTEFFFNTVLGTVGVVLSLVGIATYQCYFTSWSYRSLLVVANVAISLLSLLDIMLFTRFNLVLGIPDHIFVLGSSVFVQIIMQWQWMPQVVILSQLCPKGMEATMYALLAGCHNLGNTLAQNCGALLLHVLGVEPRGEKGESEQFRNLWVASLVTTLLPLMSVLSLFWLVPNVRQTETILGSDTPDVTSGSLWRHWTGIE